MCIRDRYVGKKKGEFVRTSNRHDYALKPTGLTALNALKDSGLEMCIRDRVYTLEDMLPQGFGPANLE